MESKENILKGKKITRREAISTAGKIAITAVITGVIAGVGGYLAGTSVAPPKTITKTVTKTAAAATVTKTVTAPGTTVTVTKPTTITTTVTTSVVPTPKVELTVFSLWSGKEEENFLKALKAFTDETGIAVKHVPQTTEGLMIGLPTQFAAGASVADVVVAPWPAWIRELGKEGHIIEVTDLIDPSKYPPSYVKLVTVDGKIYAAPFKAWAKPGFWYKKSFFEKHGLTPPKTWSEFLDLLEKLKKIPGIEAPIASGDGVGWPLSDVTEAFIIGRGSPDLQRDLIEGKVTFTDPEVRAVFEELVDLLKKGYFSVPDEWTAQIDKLWAEKYGIYFMGNWMTTMPQVKDVKDLGFFPFPETKGAVAGGDWVIVPKYTKHPEEAKKLLKFLAGPKGQEIMVRAGGFLATNVDVPAEAYTPADKAVVDFLKTVDVVPDLDDAIGGEFQRTFWDQLKLLWTSPEMLDDVLETLAEVHTKAVKKT